MTGAAPISPRIVRFYRTIGLPLIEVYGATETSGIALGQRVGQVVPGCVGIAACGLDIAMGDQGELLVRGPTVFAGYHEMSRRQRPRSATAGCTRATW